VTLVLLYLVVLVLVAVVLFGAASLLFGRGEQLPPLPRGTTATVLPAFGVTGADVDAVKFTQALRGYKTSEVDWVLDRLGRELEALRGQLAAARAAAEAKPPPQEAETDVTEGETGVSDHPEPP
jgi:DivIVA domain-containing protein